MNFRILILLSACSTACAELPPVIDETAGVTGNSSGNAASPSASLNTTYEMMKRIDQMQSEIQQLTGKVEEQAFHIEELKKQQKTMYTDFDDRIQSLENKSGAAQPSADTPADSSAPADSGAVTPPPPVPAETSQPADTSQQAQEVPKDTKAAAADTKTKEMASATPAASSAQVPENEKQAYQQAYDDLRNGRTDSAITGFNTYLSNHPGSAYASNAQYWLGEAYRVNLDNASARKAFNAVVDSYPNSAKVPDALLKLGYIEVDEKNPTKAREIFTRINSEFPASKAAALAQKKLLTLEKTAP